MKPRAIQLAKLLSKALLGLVAVLAIYLILALIGSIVPANQQHTPPPEGTPLYLISNGPHLDICLPLTAIDKELVSQTLPKDDQNHAFLSFGWGDKAFFIHTPNWADLTFSTACNSLFLPTESTMHLTFLKRAPSTGKSVRKILLRPEELSNLNVYLKNSFRLDANHKIQIIPGVDYPNVTDAFYEGKGAYHLFNTCNTWSNQALKTTGIRTAHWTPFADGILYHFPDQP